MPGGIGSEVSIAALAFMDGNQGEAESRDIKKVMDDLGKSYAPSRVMNALLDAGHVTKTDFGWSMTDEGRNFLADPAAAPKTDARRRDRTTTAPSVSKSPRANRAASTPASPLNLGQIFRDFEELKQISERQQELNEAISEGLQGLVEAMQPFTAIAQSFAQNPREAVEA